jgi:hypothetical protein
MPSYTTVKNTLKKLESRQNESDRNEYCGVIYIEDFEKLVIPANSRRSNKAGYLVVPRPMTLDEWQAEYAR